jgi:hypothetical protein
MGSLSVYRCARPGDPAGMSVSFPRVPPRPPASPSHIPHPTSHIPRPVPMRPHPLPTSLVPHTHPIAHAPTITSHIPSPRPASPVPRPPSRIPYPHPAPLPPPLTPPLRPSAPSFSPSPSRRRHLSPTLSSTSHWTPGTSLFTLHSSLFTLHSSLVTLYPSGVIPYASDPAPEYAPGNAFPNPPPRPHPPPPPHCTTLIPSHPLPRISHVLSLPAHKICPPAGFTPSPEPISQNRKCTMPNARFVFELQDPIPKCVGASLPLVVSASLHRCL